LDLRSVIKASQAISEEIALNKLLSKLMGIVIENAGAQKGYLVLETNGQLCIEAAGVLDESDTTILQSLPIAGSSQLSEVIVRYVFRSGENVVLPQMVLPGFLAGDAYLLKYQPKSVLCIPLRYQDKITGVLYLENKVTAYAFTKERVEVLQVLLAQAAISLEKAFLYDNLSREIVERKRAEERLKEYSERLEKALADLGEVQERLIRQEKLAVLGQLAGGVGHELRNPLGIISNAVYFLQMVLAETDETVKEYLELIASRVGEVDKIVADLLDLSRTRPANRQQTIISTLVAETLQRYPPPDPVTITTAIAPDLPAVFVDAQQIGQVLGNLISNAYQAMPGGGQLTIAAQVVAEWLKLSVTDTGVGMSLETQMKIFEPLFTTKAKGVGLGLAVSRSLIEVNGGAIETQSVEGQGSVFIISIPLAPEF
jgi:signal transduction histidine kinase